MTQFTLTVGNGDDNVSVSLDYQGNPDDPGYAAGGSGAGIEGAVDNFANNNSQVSSTIEAIGAELDLVCRGDAELHRLPDRRHPVLRVCR